MIKGIGIDLVELDRINQSIKRHPRFIQRILTDKERKRYDELNAKRKIEYAAGRFAAKEAVAKALGTGIGKVSFQDIEVLNGESGSPEMAVRGYEHFKIWVSISHGRNQAIAQVVLEENQERHTGYDINT